MNIKKYNTEDLILRLKQTTLKGNPDIKPYKDATIILENLNINDILPTTFYYFYDHVLKLNSMKDILLSKGLDIFHLDGYVEFEKDNRLLTLTPPIIEVVDGKNLLLDGIHRVVLSCLLEKDNIQCAIVHGAKPLPYAIENPNGWKDVKVFESEVPPGFKTRNRRYPDSEYKYYARVFNFNGTVQIPRKHHQNDDLSKLLIKNTISQSR